MKKILPLILIFLFTLPLFGIKLPDIDTDKLSKLNVPKPTAVLKKVTISKISLRDIDLEFHVEIKNPYPVKINLKGVDFTFLIENKQFFRTSTKKSLKVDARKTRMNVFNVNLKYADIIRIIQDYNNREILNCQSNVTLELWIPDQFRKALGKTIAFNFEHKTTLPAVKPKIQVVNFNVKMPSLSDITSQLKQKKKKADAKAVSKMFADILSGKSAKNVIDPTSIDVPIKVNFDIHLTNEAKAKLIFSDLNYNFFVGNDKLVGGLTQAIKQQGNVSVISIANTFSSKSLAKSIFSLFQKGSGPFKVVGSTKLKLPKKYFSEPLNLNFTENGNFKIR